jgi:autotransporter family porin
VPPFEHKKLTVAMATVTAMLSLSALPALAATYTINGVDASPTTAATLLVLSTGAFEDVSINSAMTTVTNNGTISADIDNANQVRTGIAGSQEVALLISANIDTFDNSGDIVLDTTPATGTVYKNQAQGMLHINNLAVIGNFTNSGDINSLNGVASGLSGISGMSLDNSTITSMTNQVSGRIEGGALGLSLSSSATITTLENNGLIQGGQEGIRLSDSTITTLTNQATGTINGGIRLLSGGSASIGTLTNKGLIQGTILLENGTAINTLTNQATGTLDAITIQAGANITQLTNNGQINNRIKVDSGGNITQLDNAAGGTISSGILYQGELTGSLSNAGTIKNEGTNNSGRSIEMSNGLSGSITNSGLISANFIGTTSSISAVGIDVQGLASGSITVTNTGSITANASITSPADSSAEATAQGIRVDDLTGIINIENGGTITATASALSGTSGAAANGVSVANLMTGGSLTNNGTIIARGSIGGDASSTGVSARGISINSLDGSVINNNTILVEASAINQNDAFAEGIFVGTFNTTGQIINANTITVNATAANPAAMASNTSALATGIRFSSNALDGTLDNQGDIVVTATGLGAGPANAFGINSEATISAVTGTWTNSGNISAIGVGIAAAEGVHIGNFTGSFINSGTISAADEVGHNRAINITQGSGTFNNLSGGLVSGDIEIGGTVTVTNAGTLSLPASAVGHIAGDYTQTATGLFRLSADSNSVFGQLLVGGTATLGSNANIDVDVNTVNTLANGQILASVLSAETLTSDGTFNVTDNSSIFNFSGSLSGTGTAVDLTVEKGITVADAVAFSGILSGTGAATVFDHLIENGGGTVAMADVITALGQLATEQQVADAVESTLPSISGGVALATNMATHAVTKVIASRQDLTRGLSSGDGMMTDRHIWLKPFGSKTEQDNRQGVTGYDIDSYGLALGFDGDVSASWNVGFAFAYMNSDVESNSAAGRQAIDIDSYQAKVYATNMLDDVTTLNLQAGVGISNYDSRRHIFTGDIANADYDSWNVQLNAELERSYQLNVKATLTPYVHADYSYVDVESYNEAGAGALSLNVGADSADSLIIGTGLKGTHAISDSLLLMADAGIGYDVMTDRSSLTSSFAGGGANFSTEGMKPDQVVYNAGVDAKYSLGNGTEISASYNIDTRQDYTDQSVSVTFRVLF